MTTRALDHRYDFGSQRSRSNIHKICLTGLHIFFFTFNCDKRISNYVKNMLPCDGGGGQFPLYTFMRIKQNTGERRMATWPSWLIVSFSSLALGCYFAYSVVTCTYIYIYMFVSFPLGAEVYLGRHFLVVYISE